jgi:hypothetical protein
MILAECKDKAVVDTNAAINEAYGDLIAPEDRASEPWYQVTIYNPEGLPLSDALLIDKRLRIETKDIKTKALGFDEVTIDGRIYWLPYYYVFKHKLISSCTKCSPAPELLSSEFTIQVWHELWRTRMNEE